MNYNKIYTSRFSDTTWDENIEYRSRHSDIGCIYGCPLRLHSRIPLNEPIFVIEMNNTKNKIEGIGLIRNQIILDSYHPVYKCGNYNRYIYKGQYRIDREVIGRYNENLLNILDHILFKEKTHMKRGSGITAIPKKVLKHDLCKSHDLQKEIEVLFKNYFPSKSGEDNIET